MWCKIKTPKIPVTLPNTLKTQLEVDRPIGIRHSLDVTEVWMDLDDVGFSLEEIAPILSCAKYGGTFDVVLIGEDGSNRFRVLFGPGYCSEDVN